jgi:hypothetical protein
MVIIVIVLARAGWRGDAGKKELSKITIDIWIQKPWEFSMESKVDF